MRALLDLSVARSTGFRWLWGSTVATAGAQGVERTATAWLALETGGGAPAVGLAFAARMLPSLLFGLAAGTIADRCDRRRQLLVVATAAVPLMAALSRLVASGSLHVWQVVAIAFGAGCLQVFDTPARQALILDTVPRDVAPNAVALNAVGARLSAALGALNAASSVGGMVAVVVLSALPKGVRREPLLSAVFVLYGLSILALAASGGLPVAIAVLLVIGACAAAFDALQQTLIQMAVPDEQRGRAVGIWVLGLGSAPVGHLEVGALVALLGAPGALAINGCLVIAGAATLMTRAAPYRAGRTEFERPRRHAHRPPAT